MKGSTREVGVQQSREAEAPCRLVCVIPGRLLKPEKKKYFKNQKLAFQVHVRKVPHCEYKTQSSTLTGHAHVSENRRKTQLHLVVVGMDFHKYMNSVCRSTFPVKQLEPRGTKSAEAAVLSKCSLH